MGNDDLFLDTATAETNRKPEFEADDAMQNEHKMIHWGTNSTMKIWKVYYEL